MVFSVTGASHANPLNAPRFLILSKSLESKERRMIRRVYLLVFWGRIDGEEFRKARVLVVDHFTFMVGWMLYCVVCLGRQNVKVMALRRTHARNLPRACQRHVRRLAACFLKDKMRCTDHISQVALVAG